MLPYGRAETCCSFLSQTFACGLVSLCVYACARRGICFASPSFPRRVDALGRNAHVNVTTSAKTPRQTCKAELSWCYALGCTVTDQIQRQG